jgi:diaminopropionate ammonia-lyase
MMQTQQPPIQWLFNQHFNRTSAAIEALFPSRIAEQVIAFHRQIPVYEATPLHSMSPLAKALNIDNLWIKDESKRLGLNAFKGLGGSYATYRHICSQLAVESLTFEQLRSDSLRKRLGTITFTAATAGNHGRGLHGRRSSLVFPV